MYALKEPKKGFTYVTEVWHIRELIKESEVLQELPGRHFNLLQDDTCRTLLITMDYAYQNFCVTDEEGHQALYSAEELLSTELGKALREGRLYTENL